MGLALAKPKVFRAKVEGMSSKIFWGLCLTFPHLLFILFFPHLFDNVLISKIRGVAQGLVFLEFIGNGNSIGPHPDHSHLHCHTQIYLVCKSFVRKISTVCTSHNLQTAAGSSLLHAGNRHSLRFTVWQVSSQFES